jgi:predicted nucleotidyltransferase
MILGEVKIMSQMKILIERIAELCDRWQITEFALFGSVLRDDFRPDSDIDVLVSFAPTAQRGLTENLQIRDELGALFSRPVDLLVKAAIERSDNWLRRQNILNTARVIYPSPQS